MRVWLLLLTVACGTEGQERVEERDDESEVVAGSDEGTFDDEGPSGSVTEADESVTEADESVTEADESVASPSAEEGREPDEADETREPDATRQPSAPPTGEPTVFTRVMFDLRGMPHRGPRDVDPAMIRMRTELLMHRVREAAGAPEPRLTFQPGSSVFRAEFYGAERDALAQCRRAVRQVAPPVDTSMLSGRAAFREPRATPCAPIP
jgi:hypothetical protein